MRSFWLTKTGSLMAGGGLVWCVYIATKEADLTQTALRTATAKITQTPGPLELCAIGVLLWLMGKWRRAVSKHL